MKKRFAALVLIVVLVVSALCFAFAEEAYDCWVLCQPDSEVLMRTKPSKKAIVNGAVSSGWKIKTDLKEKNGFVHLVDVANEDGFGWIYGGYVVYDEPEAVETEMLVVCDWRVACRKCIKGKVVKWLYNGSTVTVHLMSDEWSVTEYGYVQSQFLFPIEESGDEN